MNRPTKYQSRAGMKNWKGRAWKYHDTRSEDGLKKLAAEAKKHLEYDEEDLLDLMKKVEHAILETCELWRKKVDEGVKLVKYYDIFTNSPKYKVVFKDDMMIKANSEMEARTYVTEVLYPTWDPDAFSIRYPESAMTWRGAVITTILLKHLQNHDWYNAEYECEVLEEYCARKGKPKTRGDFA